MKIRINIKDYRYFQKTVVDTYNEHGIDRCLAVTIASSFPLVVTYHFLNEITDNKYLKDYKNIVQYYNYEVICGLQKSSDQKG